jgi:hypothetical protein
MIAMCTHMCTYSHSLITRLSKQPWTYCINNQNEKENELTVGCAMHQGLLFVLVEDHKFYSTYCLELGGRSVPLVTLYCDLGSWTFSFCKTNITVACRVSGRLMHCLGPCTLPIESESKRNKVQ